MKPTIRNRIAYQKGLFVAGLCCVLLLPLSVSAQDYQWPDDPLVREKLAWWQDLKFGFMMHWGTYSQWGTLESWGLCSEDQPWITRRGLTYNAYVQAYEELPKTFNPVQFDPERWAQAARAAGMKYVVFTTKHHDGFCMFDSKYTDYKITGPEVPFRDHPKANVAREIFDAFRAEGLGIGAYFSKPDWHHDDFWAPEWATPSRTTNYDTRKYPERWQRFRDFTYHQIEELMTEYGPIDILWLDGGWVRPDSTLTEEVLSWGYPIPPWEMDIDMPRIATMARRHQPGVIIVDRTVHGPYEDYRTPEQRVPPNALPYPWETNMTMTGSWGYNPDTEYKSTHQLIHVLVDVVAKGGNFLLNAGPTPEGTLEDEVYQRLAEIGAWMDVNGEAIYATRPIAPFKEGKIAYTQKKDTGAVYALYLADQEEETLPAKLFFYSISPSTGSAVTLLETGDRLPWEKVGTGALVEIPERIRRKVKSKHAWTLKIESVE